jgi:hypothetical protein
VGRSPIKNSRYCITFSGRVSLGTEPEGAHFIRAGMTRDGLKHANMMSLARRGLLCFALSGMVLYIMSTVYKCPRIERRVDVGSSRKGANSGGYWTLIGWQVAELWGDRVGYSDQKLMPVRH